MAILVDDIIGTKETLSALRNMKTTPKRCRTGLVTWIAVLEVGVNTIESPPLERLVVRTSFLHCVSLQGPMRVHSLVTNRIPQAKG